MDQVIHDFIQIKRLAVVGVSRGGKKFGNTIFNELKGRGYEVFAVNPAVKEIDGSPCHADIAALVGKVDGVIVCVPPQQGEKVLRDVASSGVKNVWLQMGADSPDLIQLGKELDLKIVAGKCILMYAPPVGSFHAFHRFFAKLFGQL